MAPPPPSVEEGRSNVSDLLGSSPSIDCNSDNNGYFFKERNYLGLSDCSSVDSSADPNMSEECKINLKLNATEWRLGLPGSLSPERALNPLGSGKLDEKQFFPVVPSRNGTCTSLLKHAGSGNKRVFNTSDEFSEVKGSAYKEKNWLFHTVETEFEPSQSVAKGTFHGNSGERATHSYRNSGNLMVDKAEFLQKPSQKRPGAPNGSPTNRNSISSAPNAKAQVVGWPPIRSYRKNTLATTSRNNNDEVDGKPGRSPLFVKVSMDGAPYLRKVDLRNYSTYLQLSAALEKMFSGFTIGQCRSDGAPGREKLSESKLRDLLNGSEYVMTYEDKDGDWMLVGDVPWEMFMDTCKRLKIMKGSDAIGLDQFQLPE